MCKHAFELVFAFDEVVAMGHKENVTMRDIQINIEMESHEEKRSSMAVSAPLVGARVGLLNLLRAQLLDLGGSAQGGETPLLGTPPPPRVHELGRLQSRRLPSRFDHVGTRPPATDLASHRHQQPRPRPAARGHSTGRCGGGAPPAHSDARQAATQRSAAARRRTGGRGQALPAAVQPCGPAVHLLRSGRAQGQRPRRRSAAEVGESSGGSSSSSTSSSSSSGWWWWWWWWVLVVVVVGASGGGGGC